MALLLLTFPDLKRETGYVTDRLMELGAPAAVLAGWRDLTAKESWAEDDEEEFARTTARAGTSCRSRRPRIRDRTHTPSGSRTDWSGVFSSLLQ